MKCGVCTKSFCGTCITSGKGKSRDHGDCPNVQCNGKTIDMQEISSIADYYLNDLKLKCDHCDETTSYGYHDTHQLIHHRCVFCSKNLPNWRTVRQHYYDNECKSAKIECDNCEFIFTTQSYYHHDCYSNYTDRQIELICVIMCTLLLLILYHTPHGEVSPLHHEPGFAGLSVSEYLLWRLKGLVLIVLFSLCAFCMYKISKTINKQSKF